MSGNEIDNERKLIYKGHYPRKVVQGNINYLDHNILCLENRKPIYNEGKDEYLLHDSSEIMTRSRSAIAVYI